MVLTLLRIIFYLIGLGPVNVLAQKAKEFRKHESQWISTMEFRQPLARTQIVLLVPDINDIFGPSVKMKAEKIPRNNTTEPAYMKSYALRTPDLTKVNFDAVPSNHTYYRDRMMKADDSLKEQRKKRGVLHLYNMVSCATGCNPLTYIGYGCYCGFLGSGYPVDGIDRCCQLHDWCYKQASCPILEYIIPYFWKCYYNRPICETSQIYYPNNCNYCARAQKRRARAVIAETSH